MIPERLQGTHSASSEFAHTVGLRARGARACEHLQLLIHRLSRVNDAQPLLIQGLLVLSRRRIHTLVRIPISHHRLLFRSRARPQLAPVEASTLGEIALQLLIDGSLAIWVVANDQSLLLLAIKFEMFRITFGFRRVERAVRLGAL